tara:strand:+ start:528 stop:899 length:372 start_codon:yes stop_codon:yes gene_type:complete
MYEIKTVGEIGVDSGQVLLIDPCYIKHANQGNSKMNYDFEKETFLNDPTLGNEKNFYTSVSERTLVGNGYGNTESGFATRTTHGDGTYKVKGIFRDDELQGIFISFTDNLNVEVTRQDDERGW